jgi:TrpR family trp operon transcriptional repressor
MRNESSEDGWQAFIRLCCQFEKPEELRELFDLFFTFEEKEALSKRHALVKALLEGKMTQREIADTVDVSISKITRGSNALKITSHTLREALKKMMA